MEHVASFDIGVYLRRTDARGRSRVEVMEFLAHGVPVVGLDVLEMTPVLHSGAGFLVQNTESFADALIVLAQDSRMRDRMGERGRRAS